MLDAPMPYIIGICEDHWDYYDENQGLEKPHLADKCVIRITKENSLSVRSYTFKNDCVE